MKDVKNMTLEEIQLLEQIQKWTKAGGHEVSLMTQLIHDYIDPSCHICHTCSNQIRLGHGKLKSFYNRNLQTLLKVKDELINGHKCERCGVKVEDRRKKYCSKECRDETIKERRDAKTKQST